jgi:hypothetical protein
MVVVLLFIYENRTVKPVEVVLRRRGGIKEKDGEDESN